MMRAHTRPKPKPQVSRARAHWVLGILMLGFAALIGKALYLQVSAREFVQLQGESRYGYELTMTLPATRGKIFDRSGTVVLASSAPVRAIWVIPEDAKSATPAQLEALAKLLGMRAPDISARIADESKNFVYLQRQVALDVAEEVRALNVPGVHEKVEIKRTYPEGDLVAHVVGFTNIDDQGLEGIGKCRCGWACPWRLSCRARWAWYWGASYCAFPAPTWP